MLFPISRLVYRTGEFSYERDPYAEFLVPPARDLLAPIRGYFRQNGAFAVVEVLEAASRSLQAGGRTIDIQNFELTD